MDSRLLCMREKELCLFGHFAAALTFIAVVFVLIFG